MPTPFRVGPADDDEFLVAVRAWPSLLFATEKSSQTLGLNPHRPTPLPAHNSPRFPPPRLFGRLPPRTSSRPCSAGVRKPLTKAAVWTRGIDWRDRPT